MNIRYNSIVRILEENGYQIFTLKDFIDKNKDFLRQSFVIAELIEDYSYLSVMTNENNKFDGFVIIHNEDINIPNPIILEQNLDLSLFQLARFAIDVDIEKQVFYQIIEDECTNQELEPTSLFLQFDIYQTAIEKERKVSIRKVGRNEPCPCNSGKKYKHCHGLNS